MLKKSVFAAAALALAVVSPVSTRAKAQAVTDKVVAAQLVCGPRAKDMTEGDIKRLSKGATELEEFRKNLLPHCKATQVAQNGAGGPPPDYDDEPPAGNGAGGPPPGAYNRNGGGAPAWFRRSAVVLSGVPTKPNHKGYVGDYRGRVAVKRGCRDVARPDPVTRRVYVRVICNY